MPQMSAPIAPSNDFSQAFQASMSGSSARTPMRDTFGGGGGPSQSAGEHHRGGGGGGDDYTHDPLGMKRKRSFTGPPSSAAATGTGAYGGAA
jgi:hypothetical protein